jgi:iron complex outermembrane receptor protein
MSLYRVTPANLIVTDFFGSIEMAPKYFRSVKQILLTKVATVPLFMEILNMMLQKNVVERSRSFENYSDFGNTTNFKVASRY